MRSGWKNFKIQKNNHIHHSKSQSISSSKRFFIFIAECIQQSPPTSRCLVYLAFLVSYLNFNSYTHQILDQEDKQIHSNAILATRYYLKQAQNINEMFFQLLQYVVPYRFLNQYSTNTFHSNLFLLISILIFNLFIIISFLYGFYTKLKDSQRTINAMSILASQICTYYNGVFLLPQMEILTSLFFNGCISLRREICPLMDQSNLISQLLIIRILSVVTIIIVILISILQGYLCDQTTNIQEKGMQKIFINKIYHYIQIILKMVIPYLYFNSTSHLESYNQSNHNFSMISQNTKPDLSIHTMSGGYFLLLQSLILIYYFIEWDEFHRFITYTDLNKIRYIVIFQFFTFIFIFSDILHNMSIIGERLQQLTVFIISPLVSLFYINNCTQRYHKILLQLLQNITYSKQILEDSIYSGQWTNLNRKIAIYISMEEEIISNKKLSLQMIGSLIQHHEQCKEVSCSCNKSKSCRIYQSNQLAVNTDHFHEFLEYLIQLHTKQQNFYKQENIYAFIQYLSYLIYRHKFTEVAGKTTYLIREKMRGALHLSFFLDVQVEALLKISKNSMIGDFQSKIPQSKQFEAFLQAGKFLQVESLLTKLIDQMQEVISYKIDLYDAMQTGFNTYYHLISLASQYIKSIDDMEKKLIKFHEFASYRLSKNLLSFFYLHVHGDFRKAKSSQKLRCSNNVERPIMNDVLMVFSQQVVTITASIGKNYGSILKYSEGTPEFFGYSKKEFFLVKRIEQLMPTCISQKHQHLVDHFVQTGDSDAVRDKRLVVIKKNRDLLYPAYLFLCFNFSYLDDFVFTAFFCQPETKDYDPKKETFLVFDQKMKLSGFSENLPQKIGIKKVSQKDSQRIELQDIFPQVDIDEILDSDVMEYSNAQFQFPLFNNAQVNMTRTTSGKSSGYETLMQSERTVLSQRSYKTIKSMNSTQFKNQEWCLFLCELKIVTFFRQFRSGEILQYYICTIKDMREESDKSDDDSTSTESFDDLTEISSVSSQQEKSDKNEEKQKEIIPEQNKNLKTRQSMNQPNVKQRQSIFVIHKENKLDQKKKKDSLDTSSTFTCDRLDSRIFERGQSKELQQDHLMGLSVKYNQKNLNKQISMSQQLQQEEKNKKKFTKTNKQKSIQVQDQKQNNLNLCDESNEQMKNSKDDKKIKEDPIKQLNQEFTISKEIQNFERKKTTNKEEKEKTQNENEQQKFRKISKRPSMIINDRKCIIKEEIHIKPIEERIQQNYSKKKTKKQDENSPPDMSYLFQKQINDQIQNYLNPNESFKHNKSLSNSFNSLSNMPLISLDTTMQEQDKPLEITSRSAITTIESEIRINTNQLYQTNEKRKLDNDCNNDLILPPEAFRANTYCDMPQIEEDINEDQFKDFSSKDSKQTKTDIDKDQSQQTEEKSFKSKRNLRQSFQRAASQIKQKISIKEQNNSVEKDNILINDDQKQNLILQILKMLKVQNSRTSMTQEQLQDMDPAQLFQKYNQVYYDSYAKVKKGKNDLSVIRSDKTKSQEIVFQKGEALSHNIDEKYDIKKYEESMNLIDKFISTNKTSRKLNLVKLFKLIELILIVTGMIISKQQHSKSYSNFNDQINFIKSFSTFSNSLNFFTSLSYLTSLQNSQFEQVSLEHITEQYFENMQQYLSYGDITVTYEKSYFTYANPFETNPKESQIFDINLRNSFFMNAYYSQVKEERLDYFNLIFKKQCEMMSIAIDNKLKELSDSINSIQKENTLLFSCIVIFLFLLFSVGIYVFYMYQKEQRMIQKIICDVPLKQIDIEKQHLHKIQKNMEDENYNLLKQFHLNSFEDEIKNRYSEYKQGNVLLRKLSRSFGVGKNQGDNKLQKGNNYVVIRTKTHIEVTIFILTLLICLLCFSVPNMYVFFANLDFIKSIPNSVTYFNYISQMQEAVTRLNTMNSFFDQNYSQNYQKYQLLFQSSLDQISEYEMNLFKAKTLDDTLLSDTQKSDIRNLVANQSICDSISDYEEYFPDDIASIVKRCQQIFEGTLQQGTQLSLSFIQNRYNTYNYQQNNFLPLTQTNELTLYTFVHLKKCLKDIEKYYNINLDQNQLNNLVLAIVIIILIIIIYIIIFLIYFNKLNNYQLVTRQIILLVPFTTIQFEDTIIKKIKKYSLDFKTSY